VVRDPALRADAVISVIEAAAELGLTTKGVTASPLPGPSGNVEFFVWLKKGEPLDADDAAALVRAAVAEGPR
jgi:23S rRNA (cytidine1920-2'-O)/16S rRNA (cytidine1409-2'-O)-methyltransferase